MAVYTDISEDDLREFLTAYDAGELTSYKGIAEGVENSNFLLHTTTAPLILTLYEKRTEKSDLPFFLGLMHHLADRGLSCPCRVMTASCSASCPAVRPHSCRSSRACGYASRPCVIAARLAARWRRCMWRARALP